MIEYLIREGWVASFIHSAVSIFGYILASKLIGLIGKGIKYFVQRRRETDRQMEQYQ